MAAGRCGLAAIDERQAIRLFGILAKVRADAGDIKRVDGDRKAGSAVRLEDPVLEAERNWAAHGWVSGPYFRVSLSIYRTAELIRQSNGSALRPYQLTHSPPRGPRRPVLLRHGEMPMGRLGAGCSSTPPASPARSTRSSGSGSSNVSPIRPIGGPRWPASPGGAPRRRGPDGAMASALTRRPDRAQAKSVFTILTKVRLAS